jgi:hypothetical protein
MHKLKALLFTTLAAVVFLSGCAAQEYDTEPPECLCPPRAVYAMPVIAHHPDISGVELSTFICDVTNNWLHWKITNNSDELIYFHGGVWHLTKCYYRDMYEVHLSDQRISIYVLGHFIAPGETFLSTGRGYSGLRLLYNLHERFTIMVNVGTDPRPAIAAFEQEWRDVYSSDELTRYIDFIRRGRLWALPAEMLDCASVDDLIEAFRLHTLYYVWSREGGMYD